MTQDKKNLSDEEMAESAAYESAYVDDPNRPTFTRAYTAFKNGFIAGLLAERQKGKEQGYYLHTDDNYYWTPEAWAEFQGLKSKGPSKEVLELVEACKEADEWMSRYGECDMSKIFKALKAYRSSESEK